MKNQIKITDQKIADAKDLYGIFFEDLNHAADGGLYGELIRNRAFEFSPVDNPSYTSLTAWEKVEEGGAKVSLCVKNNSPLSEKNPHYLTISVENPGSRAGVRNLGYNSGIPIYEKKAYRLSFYARADCAQLRVGITDAAGKEYDGADFHIEGGKWQKYTAVFEGSADDFSCRLMLEMRKAGKVDIDFVSLFPADTFMGRENGMRTDIADMLLQLKPKFMRFPGGCLVHDGSLCADDRTSCYRWKNTVGDITRRPSRRNNWGYNQSLGLGYYEYFLFCEDIGAKPLPVLPAGYNPHSDQAVPLEDMDEWINDALDLIEFANGGSDTKWGKIRTDLGHEKPFALEYLAIGNEEVGQGFWDRYDLFHKAIRKKHPEIKLINSAGPFPCGAEFERGHANAKKNGSDLIDEHYYINPDRLIAYYHRYDSGENKVFLGEWASRGDTYYNALVEAMYMTGIENNAERVKLCCYAPLLCNSYYQNWFPNMIFFDNHRVYGTPSYYVQKLFMNNTGADILKIQAEGFAETEILGKETLFGDIIIGADRCGGTFGDIVLTNDETGETFCFEDFDLFSQERLLTKCNLKCWSLEFTFCRKQGEKGVYILFGNEDKLRWNIGGWQNRDSEINADGSCLDHSVFSLCSDIEYKFRLSVNGREITAFINNERINHSDFLRPVMEELYFTASRDRGDIILKAVNIRKKSTSAEVEFPINEGEGTVYTMSGFREADKNSFDEPTKVVPKTRNISIKNSRASLVFAPQSITVIRICPI
ncbi:MAG: alpha-L-arabinofuranosidase C-terminal domain-containing protein [Clostridiales bacterium]|nr:alpha-L-arabinofuranosidase C-terminal domain-containing protein [Clostridiales bacterium]